MLTTVPDKKTSREIASRLVKERLAACVTVSGACQSSYWWKDEITQDEEFILFIKTKASIFKKLEEKIKDIHPYDVPEIIALPLIKGYNKYFHWIEKETKS